MDLEARLAAMQAGFEERISVLESRNAALESRLESHEIQTATLEARNSMAEKELMSLRTRVAGLTDSGPVNVDGVARGQAQGTIAARSYPFKPRGLAFTSLPAELKRMIVEQVAERFDSSDYNLEDLVWVNIKKNTDPDMIDKDFKSLCSLALSSKAMSDLVKPILWQHMRLDGPRDLCVLAVAVLEKGYGPFIRSLSWNWPPLPDFCPQLVRDIQRVMLLVGQSLERVVLTVDDAAAACGHASDSHATSDSHANSRRIMTVEGGTLTESVLHGSTTPDPPDHYAFAGQVLAQVFTYTENLEHLRVFMEGLRALLKFASAHTGGPAVDPAGRRFSLSNLKTLRVFTYCGDAAGPGTPDMMTLAQDAIGPLGNIRALQVEGDRAACHPIFPLHIGETGIVTWPAISTLSVTYRCVDHFARKSSADGADDASAVRMWQKFFDSVPALQSLRVVLWEEPYFRAPREVFPAVSFPSTMGAMTIDSWDDDSDAHFASVAHCQSLRYLHCFSRSFDESSIPPDTLPPFLTTFKLAIDDFSEVYSSLLNTLEALRHNVAERKYPDTLTHICLYERRQMSMVNDVKLSLPDALTSTLNRRTPTRRGYSKMFCDVIAAVLRLDEVCKDRGVTLCGPKVTEKFVTAELLERLPYRIMMTIVNELKIVPHHPDSDDEDEQS